ncbi:prepilin-type N-terminal cleavage/methylation domain-containing protein [Allochromatium humboldtianum]|uniref:Prepilin-type N-terminal cleavage/methylation domain-containing protein n=1 Tax=Allochromatium humboldtianum TaxID=504901 RepID=A0A850R236_9GAMM|nr:prepilin-type N-terminal cleavage/methylation domain-containing protein [Allochromatium humboldtianum]NVZ07644.1 prepilin-type N-terminal cleavage/methylation domain-containing protein [Allochromatium humboldtianum]
MKTLRHLHNRLLPNFKGFSLVEAMIAFVIVGVGLLGVTKLQVFVTAGSSSSQQRVQAMNLAQEKIEYFRSHCPSGCAVSYTGIANGSDSAITRGNAIYNRSWTVTANTSPAYKTVVVTVWWSNKEGSTADDDRREVVLQTKISDVPAMITASTSTGATTSAVATSLLATSSSTSSTTTSTSTTSSSTTSTPSITTTSVPPTTVSDGTTTTTTAPTTTTSTTTTTLCTTTVSGSRQNENAVITVVTPSGTCTGTGKKTYSCTVNAASGSTITIQQVSGGTTQNTTTANCENRTVDF